MANATTLHKRRSGPTASGAGRQNSSLRPQNRKLLKWLDTWLATPDDRDEKWWNGFEDDIRNHRSTFTPTQTG